MILTKHDLYRLAYIAINPKFFIRSHLLRKHITVHNTSLEAFDRLNCIFVHIPKTAGLSVCQSIFGHHAGTHTKIKDYEIIFSNNDFKNYFKFTFVRNPYDRLFSAYNFMKKGGMSEKDRKWSQKHLLQYDTFEDFVLDWVTEENIKKGLHFLPQYKFLESRCKKGFNIDFIGYYEKLNDDFNEIVDRLSLKEKIDLPITNKTYKKKLNYKDYYSQTMKDIVSKVYQKDIEIFGYDFDNCYHIPTIQVRSES